MNLKEAKEIILDRNYEIRSLKEEIKRLEDELKEKEEQIEDIKNNL
jgi:predicted  nucleic acid-binding Zn-ribbon protein